MYSKKDRLHELKRSFCAAPAPLLWKGLFFIIPLLILALLFFAIKILMGILKNKKEGKKVLDEKIKMQLLYISVVFLSLITYGLLGLDFNFYLLLFFFISIYTLGAFSLGEHFKLVVIRRELWIGVTAIAIFFGLFFVVCFFNSIRESKHVGNEPDMVCLNRFVL